ncbi:MAG: RnfABCDGE type electron transport complex subunit D [Phycisphaerae bacterium]|nr:RnfABCDGE type electron transport complex subunit D [Phycisphaerae bacterium]
MSDAPDAAKPIPLPVKDAGPRGFLVSSAPHLASGATTQRIMFDVVIAMLPLLMVAIYMYRFSAIVLTVITVAGCLAAEALANKLRGRSLASLSDGSAIVTGMILAFSLPPAMAGGSKFYMAFIGGVVAIALGKAVFGGLGNNLFNPAMVGRAFLMICFPAVMAMWTPTAKMLPEETEELALSKGVEVSALTQADVDAITTATPLYQAAKVSEYVAKANAEPEKAEKYQQKANEIRDKMPGLWRLTIGNVGGCVGETSALLALICGLWLVFRGIADWRQPLALLVTVIVFALITNAINSERFAGPLYHLTSGALMFGAFFIATDYVGAPVNPWGRLIFGAGVGLLVMLIRVFGTYPEGFMFAILIMNSLTPLIERWTTPTPFGGHVEA